MLATGKINGELSAHHDDFLSKTSTTSRLIRASEATIALDQLTSSVQQR
jgi:hypothetical protein